MAVSGMTVNLSLTEQTIAATCHNYWLRVGVVFEEQLAIAQSIQPDDATHDAVASSGQQVPNVADEAQLDPDARAAGQDECVQPVCGSVPSSDTPTDPSGSPPRNPDELDYNNTGSSPQETGEVKLETLYTLAVLAGDVAKWMVPRMEDWVELSAVSAWRICRPVVHALPDVRSVCVEQVDPLEFYMVGLLLRATLAHAPRRDFSTSV
jgi:hypothetical protein